MKTIVAENFENTQAHYDAGRSSERLFGFFFAGLFLIIGLYPLLKAQTPNHAFLIASAALAMVAFLFPASLKPLNILWMRLGEILSLIVGQIIMAFCFYGIVVPLGLMKQYFEGTDQKYKFDQKKQSYWIEKPAQARRINMKVQF